MRGLNSGSVWMVLVVASAWGCSAGTGDISGIGGAGGSGGAHNLGGFPDDGTTATGFEGVGANNDMNSCDHAPSEDGDMDGQTGAEGDCNDCDPNVNTKAIEVIPDPDDGTGGGGGAMEYEPADEDCDGTADNVPQPCDEGLAIEGLDARDGARAMGLCKDATPESDWGVVSAAWTRANGTATTANVHMGILDAFGANVATREGARMLAISSGTARDASDPGYINHTSTLNGPGTPPPGFPQGVPNCPGGTNINDDVALDLTLKAPSNATGFKYDFKFYSNEYPEWVCTTYNDQYIALMNPAPMGALNGNITFDSMNNPVSVNIAFFDVCQGCTMGTAELQGTGYGDGEGGTSWLQTTAPVTGGSTFSIRFAIWDTGDTAYDSISLLDGFEWIANGGTVTIGTTPIPE